MPGGDQTGPMGAGPMTGRGTGMCAGYDVPGHMNPAFGRGLGRGRGRGFGRGSGMGGGRGWRNQYYATGLPGWARGGGYPYPGRFPAAASAPPTMKTARREELKYLTEQAQYLREALDDIETRINGLRQEAGEAGKVQKKEEE